MCHTASYYYVGKDPTFAFGTAVPFGLNSRMQTAWQYFGGGMELMNDFYKKCNIYGIPCGNTGCQMGGWFRKEIKDVVRPQRPEDAHRRLRRPRADQARRRAAAACRRRHLSGAGEGHARRREWVGPYDDEKLGFHKVAQYYYYPGWWEGGAMLHNFINIEKWNALPPTYKSIVRTASMAAHEWMQAKYDAGQSGGAQAPGRGRRAAAPVPASRDGCLPEGRRSSSTTKSRRTNADFKKVYESTLAFRNDQYLWWQVAEYTYDTFLIRNRTRV